MDEIFKTFGKNAIAAASLAQVHHAILKVNVILIKFKPFKKDGTEVAVKLQFPFLRVQTNYDLIVIRNILKICNRLLQIYHYKDLNLLKMYSTFKTALIKVIH